jgi:methylmalonyl-CoA/ethylmalonyl-CoA epimerase
MAEQTTNKLSIPLGRPVRVAMIVRDARATVQALWSYFGIGPFRFEDWPGAERPGFMPYFRGRPAQRTMTLGSADLGSLELQLIQPLHGESHYASWLAERGEGLHHLALVVDDLDAAKRELTRAGIEIESGAHGGSSETRWILANTEPLLGWNMEIYNCLSFHPRNTVVQVPHGALDQELFTQQPCIRVGRPVQIGVVTRDARRQADALGSLLGLGPFRFHDWPGDRPDMQAHFRGRPGRFRMRLGFGDLGNVQLELIQPLEGESLYTEFLARRGPGLHHLLFDVADLDDKLARLAKAGIAVRMSGSGLVPGTRWLYLDTEHLIGWSLELRGPATR